MRNELSDVLLAQRETLFCWVPVCLGIGIGVYFGLSQEPDAIFLAALCIAICILLVLWRLAAPAFAPLVIGLVLVFAGIGIAKWRVEAVSAPVLTFRYYGPIEGHIVNIDRSANDAVRLTLDRVVLARMDPIRTPARVRVSLYGDQPLAPFTPGDHMILTGHLSPPAGPAEPGGFDFQRHAWFLKLGAVGYTRTPVLRLAEGSDKTLAARIFRLRMAISTAVQMAMPGETGAFAAAIMTGDRSGMAQETLTELRAANLAHLLAISGLHMGLLTGFIFAVIRYGIAIVPGLALRVPAKKLAAIFALAVGAFYLALSGGNVATERAFIMVAVMLVAVLLDRRALTLRAVAIAAIIVLIWQPEAMTGPGFQMSFAATTALVAAFGGLRRFDLWQLPRWTRPVLSVVVSSFIAGLATAPFAAAHFNQIAHYGLFANILSVPLMGLLVMPAAVLTACLVPLGLWEIGLWLMDKGLSWILFVADVVSARPGALSHIWAPHASVLPVLTLGLIWCLLIRGSARWAGIFCALFAAVVWAQSTRPALLVADNGSLIGLISAEGRSLSRPRGSGFVAGIWLENDGAPVPQDVAAARQGLEIGKRRAQAQLGDWSILQISGKTALAGIAQCDGADVLITNQDNDADRPCLVFDQRRLRETGALAMDIARNGDLIIETAQHVSGARAWNRNAASQERIVLAHETKRDAAASQMSSITLPDQ